MAYLHLLWVHKPGLVRKRLVQVEEVYHPVWEVLQTLQPPLVSSVLQKFCFLTSHLYARRRRRKKGRRMKGGRGGGEGKGGEEGEGEKEREEDEGRRMRGGG